jgi:predicted permease
MNSLYKDFRYSVRRLYKNAGFSSAVIGILALGIGLCTATFTVVYALFISPLPYPEAHKLVAIGQANRTDSHPGTASLPNIRDWRSYNSSFQDIGYWNLTFRNIQSQNVTESIADVECSANLFRILGKQPHLGRGFAPDEDQPGKDRVAVLSAALWRHLFPSDPAILGQSVKIGNETYSVIGVMSDGITFPLTNQNLVAWVPLQPGKDLEDRNIAKLSVIGRLKNGKTITSATTELNAIQSRVASQNAGDKVVLEGYREMLVGNIRPALLALEAAVLAVWLIACLNVLSLILARTANRRHDMAIRCAIGATRNRLLAAQLIENAVLCSLGAVLGLLVSTGIDQALRFYLQARMPFAEQMHINLAVIGVVAALSFVSTLAFTIVPTLQVYRTAPRESLVEGAAAAGTSRRQKFVHNGLVIAEVALSFVLLVVGGLLFHTIYSLRSVPLGFQAQNLLVSPLTVPQQLYAGKDIVQLVYEPVLSHLRELPDVESAAISTILPMNPNSTTTVPVEIFGKSVPQDNAHTAQLHIMSPSFYRTLGIRTLAGRTFAEADNRSSPWVVVVNQSFVRKYFPNEEPLEKRIRMNEDGPNKFASIVGVVEDTQQKSLAIAVEPEIDLSYLQVKPQDDFAVLFGLFAQVAVRTKSSPSAVAPEVIRVLREINPDLAGTEVTTVHDVIDKSLESQTLAARLLGMFAGSALIIAVFGLYGLLSYNLSRSKRDIGLRLALGATPKTILRMVLGQALILVITGILIGILLTLQAGQLLRSFLYGVGPYDFSTVCLVAVVLVSCGLTASFIPARRASRVDPIQSLRFE